MEEAEIWESAMSPESIPSMLEQGASAEKEEDTRGQAGTLLTGTTPMSRELSKNLTVKHCKSTLTSLHFKGDSTVVKSMAEHQTAWIHICFVLTSCVTLGK